MKENELLEKIMQNVSIADYEQVKNYLYYISFSSCIYGVIKGGVDPSCLPVSLACASISASLHLLMCNSKAICYTKEAIEAKKLYDEIIKNYNFLNRIFSLNDPVAIYAMFNYALHNGYLSLNKKYTSNPKYVMELPSTNGIGVVTNNNLERHNALMLSDVLRKSGIYSNVLGVTFNNDLFLSLEDMVSFATIGVDNESFSKEDFDISQVFNCSMKHVLTYASSDGKQYFFDPTLRTIFKPSKTEHSILFKGNVQVDIDMPFTKKLISKKEYLELKKELSCQIQSTSIQRDNKIVYDTNLLCSNNRDILEKFYYDNKELYEEIDYLTLKFKKRSFN